ncbi:MAG: hypothetical protein V8S74_08495 [Lachnospirales bacterium]
MNKPEKIIYVNANKEMHEYIYTGINFREFMEYLQKPIENIILLRANYIGNNFQKNFELIEGHEYINELAKENIYNWGDFYFADYSHRGNVDKMNDREISELLYLSHMNYPLHTPFFKSLENNFVYLSHDDGFYCKLYSKKGEYFSNIVANKIREGIKDKFGFIVKNISTRVQSLLLDIAENGILLDVNELKNCNDKVILNVYLVGKYFDMDKIFNNYESLKKNSVKTVQLIYSNDKWDLYKNKIVAI